MSKTMQYIPIGKFVLGIPDDKMFDVATLKIDLRPAIKNLKQAGQPTITKVDAPAVKRPVTHRWRCRRGCNNWFVKAKNRRTHERKYHVAVEEAYGR